jgi:putative tryptophan/tyrosine transport system substrate-binding protein
MNRRAFVTGLGAVLAAPFAAEAQQGDRLPRMGFLSVISLSDPSLKPYFSDFRRALGDVGLVEGENITIEWRSADGNYQRLPDLAAELVRLKMDLIVASGGPPVVRAVQRATATIPIVMTTIGDPVAAGLVASLARPGGNVTGRTIVTSELVGKRLDFSEKSCRNYRAWPFSGIRRIPAVSCEKRMFWRRHLAYDSVL